MPRYLKYAVLLAALALAGVSGSTSAKAQRSDTGTRCMQDWVAVNYGVVQPGQIVNFEAVLRPSHVDVFTLTAVKLPSMQLLRKGSAPFSVVEGLPTWTRNNVSSETHFRFRVIVSKHAVRGRRLIVQFSEHSVAANCDQTDQVVLPLHVAKHPW